MPPVLERTKAERRIIRRIERLVQKAGLIAPDLTAVSGDGLKEVLLEKREEVKWLRVQRRIIRLAEKKSQELPDLSLFSLSDLTELQKALRRMKPQSQGGQRM